MSRIIDSTPTADGFHMPGEFSPHAGCFMIWPERPDNWRLGGKPAQKAFTAVASAISSFEPLTMGVSAGQWENARRMLPPEIRLVELSSNDAWVRDTGPTCVVNDIGEVRGIDWQFNAWGGLEGGLYFPWDRDAQVAEKICNLQSMGIYKAPLILEGGSIHVDGEGTCIVTEECLLNKNRNPQLSRQEIEGYLRAYLGVSVIIWVPEGVYLDETDGHVDNMVCIPRPGEVILHWTDDVNDPQYPRSAKVLEVLSAAVDAKGRKLKVHKLLQPTPMFMTKEESDGVDPVAGTVERNGGSRLAGSYVNHYIANGGIVMPIFGVPEDELALKTLQSIYHDRQVVAVPAREILLGGGNIHCITQQIPAGLVV
ncbi:MAG TPA: agmatine deiminase [Rhodocyclaceae bacterium]|nr:agmatine deiminase [Rhodocyclaceae bacterium]